MLYPDIEDMPAESSDDKYAQIAKHTCKPGYRTYVQLTVIPKKAFTEDK